MNIRITSFAVSRISLAVIWIYHGIIPKLLFKNEQEVMMNDILIPFLSQDKALFISGWIEVLYGVFLLLFYRNKWLLYPALIFSSLATVLLFFVLPELFINAFNPASINLAVFALALINYSELSKEEDLDPLEEV